MPEVKPILIPIALCASLSWRGLGMRNRIEGLWRQRTSKFAYLVKRVSGRDAEDYRKEIHILAKEIVPHVFHPDLAFSTLTPRFPIHPVFPPAVFATPRVRPSIDAKEKKHADT